MVELKNVGNLLHVAKGVAALNQSANALLRAADSLGDLINILRLDDGLEVIFQQLGEVICTIC